MSYLEDYLALGLKPIPLYPGSKRPIGTAWHEGWSLHRCQALFERMPDCNVGILLGDVVDVEGDTDEANERLERLTAGVPHPVFHSRRSTHHLFRNNRPDLTLFKIGAIEFRAHRHQSVLPPSRHESGAVYEWLTGLMPLPPLPRALSALVDGGRVLKPGHATSWCPGCRRRHFLHGRRLALERRLLSPWLCRSCRPTDLRPACRELRRQAPTYRVLRLPANDGRTAQGE